MKKIILGMVVCLGGAIGSAQSMEMLKVTLPVAANIGSVTLQAGTYTIYERANSVIDFRSDVCPGVSTFATVNSIELPNMKTAQHSKVVLRKDVSGYQVDKIWIEGQKLGFELTRAE